MDRPYVRPSRFRRKVPGWPIALLAVATQTACGPLDGFRTAGQVRAVHERYAADTRQLARLEAANITPAITSAARKYRTVLATHAAALVVNSALEFGTAHGGGLPAAVPDAGGLFGSIDIARSRLLMTFVDAPGSYRASALGCVHTYDACVEQPQDAPLACNHALLVCLADRLSGSGTL